jgi:hypothetical protein
MSDDKNLFGGGNVNSLYVPMSDVEQEAIQRLIEAEDLRVHVIEWGIVNRPRVTLGDARLAVAFQLSFDRPEVPMPVPFFDLELRTGSGVLLFKDRQTTQYAGKPISIAAGMVLSMVWDIAIQNIDPKLVKSLVPHAKGLTSRLQDKDTGDMTVEGNMKLDGHAKKVLRALRQAERRVRALDGKKR